MLAPALAGFTLLVALPAPARPAVAPPQDTVTLVIAATTDVHGRLMSWDYERGRDAPLGLVRVRTAVDSLRRVHGADRVIVVDAGDLLQGNGLAAYYAQAAPPRGTHPVVDAMNRIGYDVVTPGNHEYNFGVETFARMRRGARFRYVSANTEHVPSGAPAFPVSAVLTRAGIRVGITGVTTPGVMVWDGARVRGRLRLRAATEAAPPVLRQLAGQADVTVLLAHAGLAGPSSYDERAAPPENTIAAVIAAAPRLDVVVLGHTHREIADSTIGATLVVQPGAYARSLAVAEVTVARDARGAWRVVRRRGALVRLDRVAPDSSLVAAFTPAHDAVRRWIDVPIGRAAAALPAARARLEDTPLIDFINAVQQRVTGAELSAAAAFDVRAGLPEGPIRLRDVAAVYPYENNLLRAVRISGADLRAYLEHAARYYRGVGPDGAPAVNDSVPGYNFDIIAGAEYELDVARPLGSRVTRLTVRGRPVEPADSFTLALNDYRQQGGGGFPAVAGAPVVFQGTESVRDLLAAEIRRRGTIAPADYFVPSWTLRPGPERGAGSDTILLRVLSTNDLHGRLEARAESWSGNRPVGGVAHLAGMMQRLEAECACPTLRVDAGDMMQGTPVSNLTFGRATIEAANAVGYHAAAVGNHEFDWTVDTLAARIRDSRFPWLTANTVATRPLRRPAWVTPWRMVTAGPRRVAVIGYTSPGTTTSTNPLHVAHLGFFGAATLDSVIAAARGERPDFVVVLAHEGGFCNGEACDGAVMRLAQALRHRPDLIVSGHTHSLVTTTVNGIPIVQARSGGTALGIVDIVRADTGRAVRVRVETVWADRERPDTAVARVVERYVRAADSLTRRVIAELAQPLHRDSGLGAMIAEAQRRAAGTQVGLINASGIRRSLLAGPATWGDLFEVQPFGNFVVRLEVTGAVLRAAIEHGRAGGDIRAHLAGVSFRYDGSRPAGERVTALTLADGTAVTDDGRYTLGTADFLANGGSGYAMLRGLPSTNTGMTDLDALIRHLQSLPQPVRAPDSARGGGTP